jgi:hypothetical protein
VRTKPDQRRRISVEARASISAPRSSFRGNRPICLFSPRKPS